MGSLEVIRYLIVCLFYSIVFLGYFLKITFPETNITPEHQWLEYEMFFWMAYLQRLC